MLYDFVKNQDHLYQIKHFKIYAIKSFCHYLHLKKIPKYDLEP